MYRAPHRIPREIIHGLSNLHFVFFFPYSILSLFVLFRTVHSSDTVWSDVEVHLARMIRCERKIYLLGHINLVMRSVMLTSKQIACELNLFGVMGLSASVRVASSIIFCGMHLLRRDTPAHDCCTTLGLENTIFGCSSSNLATNFEYTVLCAVLWKNCAQTPIPHSIPIRILLHDLITFVAVTSKSLTASTHTHTRRFTAHRSSAKYAMNIVFLVRETE